MSDQSAPSPAASNPQGAGAPKAWEPPTSDQEFKFEKIDSAPAWIDKSWASFSQGPALAVPQGNLDGTGPYHTTYARVGDTVKFVAAKGATPGHMVVIPGEVEPGKGTKKPPQQSAASLEDSLRLGVLSVDDLGEDAKAQVAARTPGLAKMIEDGTGAPEAQSIGDSVKTS